MTLERVEGGEIAAVLLPERAVYLPGASVLLVSDVHLGKCETLRVVGAPIPDGVIQADLARLASAVGRTGARRVVVAGDLVHAAAGLTSRVMDLVGQWRHEGVMASVELTLVPGNHDRRVGEAARRWAINVTDIAHVDDAAGITCVHDPAEVQRGDATWRGHVFCGHVHPRVRLRGRGDGLSLPCFWSRRRPVPHTVLPAFSVFTAGVGIEPEGDDALWALAEDRIVVLRGGSTLRT